MSAVLDHAAAVVAAASVLAALVVLARVPGGWRTAVALGLELAVAAGLLRLSASQSWTALGTAAVVVALRTLVRRSLALA